MKFHVLILAALCALSPVAHAQDDADDGIGPLVDVLGQVDDPAFHLDILKGINEALKGRANVKMPASWKTVYPKLQKSPDAKVREAALNLALVFGDDSALKALMNAARDAKTSASARQDALQSLIHAKAKNLAPLLHDLLKDRALRRDALRALARYEHPKNGEVIIALYPSLSLEERRAALGTLASRTPTGKQLITAIEGKKIARSDVPADTVRQLRLLKDKSIDAAVKNIWGEVRDTPADKKKQIDKLKKMLETKTAYKPDLSRGRALFAQTCQQCHTLFGVGGKVGPDVTGSNRNNLDYVLQNVIDPNALVGKDYQATEVRTEDDQHLVGIIEREDAQTLTLKTAGGTVIVAKDEIETRKLSDKSMMPEALINHLSDNQLRDFVAYLAGSTQVPMLATEANAWGLFNGTDLSNWQGDEKQWSVKDGAIIGDARNVKEPIALVSDYLVSDFELSLTVTISKGVGKKAGRGQLMVRGQPNAKGRLTAAKVQLGGDNEWGSLEMPDSTKLFRGNGNPGWVKITVIARGDTVEVKSPQLRNVIHKLSSKRLPSRGRIELMLEPGAVIKIKDVQLKVLTK